MMPLDVKGSVSAARLCRRRYLPPVRERGTHLPVPLTKCGSEHRPGCMKECGES